jgi:hypothetical protein
VAPLLRPFLLPLCHLAAIAALLLGAGTASAISLTPPPGSGLGQDDGGEIFCPCDLDPNPSINRHVLTIREAFDGVNGTVPHEWGIYFASDPSQLIPVFTVEDGGPGKPVAQVDFDNGTVTDLDTMVIEFTFDPQVAHFGIYLKIEPPAGPATLLYSQAALNGGVDAFGSFPTLTNNAYRVVAFEIRGQILALEAVVGACYVPEPSVAFLLGGGLLLLGTRRTRVATHGQESST